MRGKYTSTKLSLNGEQWKKYCGRPVPTQVEDDGDIGYKQQIININKYPFLSQFIFHFCLLHSSSVNIHSSSPFYKSLHVSA
jgi:hypothetical protein